MFVEVKDEKSSSSLDMLCCPEVARSKRQHEPNGNCLSYCIPFISGKAFLGDVDQKPFVWVVFSKIQVKYKRGKNDFI